MKNLTFLLACVILQGCVQVGPKTLPVGECPKLTVPQCPTLVAPKEVNMPGIPEVVTMKIRGDVIVECDAGCESLIRNYAKAQELLRSP